MFGPLFIELPFNEAVEQLLKVVEEDVVPGRLLFVLGGLFFRVVDWLAFVQAQAVVSQVGGLLFKVGEADVAHPTL